MGFRWTSVLVTGSLEDLPGPVCVRARQVEGRFGSYSVEWRKRRNNELEPLKRGGREAVPTGVLEDGPVAELFGAGDDQEQASAALRRSGRVRETVLLAYELKGEVEPPRIILDHTTHPIVVLLDAEAQVRLVATKIGVLNEVGQPLVYGQLEHLQAVRVEGGPGCSL
jgi:hypothetical protein